MSIEVDIAIVGARIAGSVSASLLGAAGYRVLVVDSATFPSDTISTHFFRGAGLVTVLARLGLLDDVLALGSPPLIREYDFHGDDPTPVVEGPQDPGDIGFCLSVRRRPLDHLLVERARATPNVEVWEGAIARSLLRDGDRVAGLIVERGGVTQEVRGRMVVGADGRASAVARWLEAPEERREPATRAMYYRYVRGFRGPEDSFDGPVFSLHGDELAYAFPSDDGMTCIALSVNLAAFAAFRGAPEARFAERLTAHPGLAKQFAASSPEGRILGSGPKDAIVRMPAGPGWALVGDASLSQDPWTGFGMDNAATHAVFLTEAIDTWLSGRSSEIEAFVAYHGRRDEHALPGFAYTADNGRDLSVLG
ncbi:MAG TPA: NAD(P)/FAD-dependent oxidoreductase [Candidatus Limnocylindrales bacterium]